MRQSSVLIVTLLVGLGAGTAAGYWLGSTSSGAESTPALAATPDGPGPLQRKVSTSVELAAANQPSRPAPAAWDPDGQAAEIAAMAEKQAAAVARRVAAEDGPERDPSWTGVITGEIVDPSGAPITGATVVTAGIMPWSDGIVAAKPSETIGRAYSGRPSFRKQLEDAAKVIRKSELVQVEAQSDEGGRFELTGLEAGTHTVQAYAEGYIIGYKEAATGGGIRLIGSPVGRFALDLRLPDGTEPAEAIVIAVSPDGDEQVLASWAPDATELRLSRTQLRVRFLAGKVRAYDWRHHVGEFTSDVITLVPDPDPSRAAEYSVTLKEQTQLRVTVEDKSTVLPRLDPWVKLKAQGQSASEASPMKRRGSGPYMAPDLQEGAYEVLVGRGAEEPEVVQVIEVGPGLNLTEITLGEIDPDSFIVATCTGPEGRPVPEVSFQYSSNSAGGQHVGGIGGVVMRPGGEYWLGWTEVLQGRPRTGTTDVEITALAGSYGSQTKPVGEDGRVAFSFVPGCELTVMVSDAPRGKVRVQALEVLSDAPANDFRRYSNKNSAVVDSTGSAAIGLLQPGEYTVTVAAQVSDWQYGPPIAQQTVRLTGGPQTLRLACPPLQDLVLLAPDHKPGTDFHLSRVSSTAGQSYGWHASLDSDGRAVFSGLTAGPYLLNCWSKEGRGQMEISIPCGEVVFEPMQANGLLVVRVTGDTAGARAGLMAGDILVGVNEHKVGEPLFRNRMWIEMSEGPATLYVQRGTRTLELKAEKLGGDVARTTFGVEWRETSLAR